MPSANALSPGTVAAAGGVFTQDVHTAGEDFLTVVAQVGPTATAAGDVSVRVVPYFSDLESTDHGAGPTLMPTALALVADTVDPGVAAVLVSNKAYVMLRVRVTGIDKVQVQLVNNNATTALPGRLDVYYD